MAHPDFNPPGKPPKLTGRKSTLTGLFFVTLTPYIRPSDEEIDEALLILGMARGAVRCAYCGDKKSEWDHFRPIVNGRAPTGYITEIANLVPSCGKCNQSKSGNHWRTWILGGFPQSPATRKIADLESRVARLEAFESWRIPIRIPYAELGDEGDWQRHLSYLEGVLNSLATAEQHAERLRKAAETWIKRSMA
jgi:hypothetical protein